MRNEGNLVDVRAVHDRVPGDQYDAAMEEGPGSELAVPQTHAMDSPAMLKEHRRVLEWYYLERELQATNRMEMAMDADMYDGLQWEAEDIEELKARGQMPLVYNEVAPMVDWMIGTERRSRVDWSVLPRTEDDVDMADVKTKVMKYVSDVNQVPFTRSRVFTESIKAGVCFLDDGVRDDPTKDALYSKFQDWRCVLWDSKGYDLDLDDGRFIFRWRWVDEDVALMMYPERADAIRCAVEDSTYGSLMDPEEDSLGNLADLGANVVGPSGRLYATGSGLTVDAKRRRVKLIECQYRIPVPVKVVGNGPMQGTIFQAHDQLLADAVARAGSMIVDKVMMRTHFAAFTEAKMLAWTPSLLRHNSFSLTPVWCYRRSRDRMPYGIIRRVRDVQRDLNKRASKALFMLNTNQIIAEEGAVEDWEEARDEVDRADGLVVVKPNKRFDIRRDTDQATGQIQLMTMDAQAIQKSAGVAQENMGRQTNAVSGEAIKARQLQGSVVTTEPFDNLRFATQCQGQKQLSLAEQFYSEEKVIRLTGAKGKLEWLTINKPEVQPDGSVRFLNDITASQADFIVSEQDYTGTLRQVMFENLNAMAAKMPPELMLRMLTIAMEFSDLPNKDEIADQIRKLTGDRDPSKEPTPEEQQQLAQQQEQQAQQLELQRQQAVLVLEEGKAKVREINAKAAKLESDVQAGGAGAMQPQMEQALMQVRAAAADQIDQLSNELAQAQKQAMDKTMAINKEADTAVTVARIEADSRARVAEIGAASDKQLAVINARVEALTRIVNEKRGQGPASKGE